MTTRERLDADFITALKAKDAAKKSALGMLRAAVKNVEIDKRTTLEEAEVVEVIGREVKKLRDGLDSFVSGGREDLAEAARSEIAIAEAYLPAQMDEATLKAVVDKVIAASGEVTEKDFGRIMKEVVKETAGQADGKMVSAAVKAALAGK